MPLSSVRARLIGDKGRRVRWARTTPLERDEFMRRVREGRRQRYLARAAELPGGADMTAYQLAERAEQLRLADLADMRIAAYDARQRKAGVR